MVPQEKIVQWYVDTQIPFVEEGEKADFLFFLEEFPGFIEDIMIKNVPSIIDDAAKHFKEGLEIKGHDFQQFGLALAEGLKKRFIAQAN